MNQTVLPIITTASFVLSLASVPPSSPFGYLRRVFTELPRVRSLSDVEALLPTPLTAADLT